MTASYLLNAILRFPRIRRAEAADLPAIRALHARSLRTLGRPFYGAFVHPDYVRNGIGRCLGLVHMRKELVRTARAREIVW